MKKYKVNDKNLVSEYYKDYVINLGDTDIAQLFLFNAFDSYRVEFGGDCNVKAYITHNYCDIPKHYTLKKVFYNNVTTYTDSFGDIVKIDGDIIEIYTAGLYSVLINIVSYDKIKTYKKMAVQTLNNLRMVESDKYRRLAYTHAITTLESSIKIGYLDVVIIDMALCDIIDNDKLHNAIRELYGSLSK